MKRLFFSAFICFVSSTFAVAQLDSALIIKDQKDFYPLNKSSFIFQDRNGKLKIDSITKVGFQPLTDEIYSFSKFQHTKAFWVKSTIQNLTQHDLSYIFYLHPGADSVELYYFHPDGVKDYKVLSSLQNTRDRPSFISQEIVAPILLKRGKTNVYFRFVNRSVWSQQMASIIISLAPEMSFVNYFLEFRFYQGIALGMLLLLLIFHIFIYIFFRDATYFAYLINIFFTLFYLLLRKNYLLEFDFLAPIFPIIPYLHDPAGMLISVTAIWFSQLFLNLKEQDPFVNKIMKGLILIQVMVAIFTLSFQLLSLFNELSIYLGFLSAIFVIIASVRSYRHGNKLALYVFFGFILLAVVPIIYIIPLPNYLHYRTSESDIHFFGESIRAIIFAVGIAERFYQLKREVARKEIEKNQILLEQTKLMQAERERISRDLHDNIGSQLAMLSMELGVIAKHYQENPALESVKANTKTVISQLRDTVWVLENEKVMLADLENKLILLIQPQQKTTHIQCTMQIPDSIKNLTLSPSQAISVFRIVQEALQNAIKHSQCNLIKIILNLYSNNKSLLVQISDDGIGFDARRSVNDEHYGLRNMRKRAAEINGELEIITSKEKGTTISLYFPTD